VAIYVLNTNPDAIDFGHAALQARVEAYLGRPVTMYRPLTFVEHSGFSETVREEIALVLANHAAAEPPLLAFDDFVDAWDVRAHLDRRVLDLSGGWRKYLGLALYMNRPSHARLLLDVTSHLSDARMRTVLTHAGAAGDAVFAEYDPQLLLGMPAGGGRPCPPLVQLTDEGGVVREAGVS
jgi:hypothetical protein